MYFEGDDITCIYFLKNGVAGYVLSRYQNLMYVTLNRGGHFGVSDILGSLIEKGNFHIDDWIKCRENLKRQFTVQCKEQCELLTLSIQDLDMMKNEFYDAYTVLFQNSFNRLRRTIMIKLKAIKYCDKFQYNK